MLASGGGALFCFHGVWLHLSDCHSSFAVSLITCVMHISPSPLPLPPRKSAGNNSDHPELQTVYESFEKFQTLERSFLFSYGCVIS